MSTFRRFGGAMAVMVMALTLGSIRSAQAQFTQVVFEDDFSSNTIDPAKYQADAPFFEGGVGDIHAEAGGGVMRFVGTTSQQWWAGGTLRVVPTFNATEESPLTVSVDRVAEAGVGTASRSALWILDETQTKYVLFADVRGEEGWRYNRKIGEDGDAPTGGGTIMTAFDGASFDDGGLHRMQMVANGKTVKLMLDGIVGAEVKFPFSKVVIHFGSYARANNDTADTTWDNLKIETVPQLSVVFSDDFSGSTIDPAKFQPDAPFFEGGVGDIHAEIGNGVMKFVGTTSQQWWSGGTLRVVPTFNATEQTPVVVSIDRVAEAGVGTASRSALWILDETQTKYILFADVRGEEGWRYNRKIGEDGDAPTGGGTIITAFDGESYDDGGFHKMGLIADGKTVKLLLDGVVGAEVKFPFSKVVLHFGSYARANNDTADTTWDNIKVETIVTGPPPALFEDDFSSNTIDPARYAPDAPFFEGGVGDIHAEAGNGVMRFVGTTTQQWWSGGTLRIVPTFAPSESETVTLTIDRVAEAGVGTASRSALWILDETQANYVLFADVRGEEGWRYNRKIGEDGDAPTGGGTIITAFDGPTFDDGGLHQMRMVADGKTVKLFLDGIPGPEVKFPFSPVVFQFGSYARANNDTADTTWDNLRIESTGSATFVSSDVSVRVGTVGPPITVRIPQGFNSQRDITVRVVSAAPSIALPDGGTGSSLALTFPAGGPNTQTFRARGVALGGTQFSLEGDIAGGNRLNVAVISGPALLLEDSFAGGSLDATKWQASTQGFEPTGTGAFTVAQTGGALEISGSADGDFWPGASAKSVNSFVATRDLNLVVEVDRASIDLSGTAGRTGVYITTADRSRYLFFGHNFLENGWQVNAGDVGAGVNLAAFDDLDQDVGSHRMKLVANGQTVEVFLDGRSGGVFALEASTGLHVELGVYARAAGDTVVGRFDNVRVENLLPCVTISPSAVSMTVRDSGRQATVTIPQLLNDTVPVTVTVTSRTPGVAIPAGAVNGVLTLNFAAGAPNSQTFNITPVGKGSAVFEVASTPTACVGGTLVVDVVAVPQVLLTDDFSGTSVDANKWVLDETPFDTGLPTAESAVTVAGGVAEFNVTAELSLWAGYALLSKDTYSAAATTPTTFEIDRVSIGFVLTTGTGAEQRTGIWVKEPSGNFVFFSEYLAHDGRNYGWRYNKVTGAPDDDAVGVGVNIGAFDPAAFNDRGKHRMKVVANGATLKLYLDDIFGAEVPFPYSTGLTFGFASYVDETGNVVIGKFDNARILGGEDLSVPDELTARAQGGNVVVTWVGTGRLQQSSALGAGAAWADVTPAPTGNTYTTPANASPKFYRTVK
ncbi:MAG: hypothetical protein AB7O66_11435 [Limisphaerales bacterium]